ncbi:DNA excision repair protein ERCC-6-like isoform X2 [Gambusia affinis]|uniref:DNA excision repair protein ERCC-6-like isoform X2 n=1 Tax=Gambusia affinis TaxID=33528 RepID=UPI001CDD8388|nr:DNA excision repair protein ERCC-6-like isoform X2 [Gambusia affinis]
MEEHQQLDEVSLRLRSLSIDAEQKMEKYERLISDGKAVAKQGDIQQALKLFKQAFSIHQTPKLESRIKKIEELLAENDLEDEDDEFVNVNNSGLMLFKELHDKLYDYQRDGVSFLYGLYRDGRKGGVLADDMGLGKTIQIISFLSGMYDNDLIKHTLLVMPTSLITNWVKEFSKWTPGMRVKDFHGASKAERTRSLEKVQRRGGVIITTYTMLMNNWQQLASFQGKEFCWDYMILDEAHKIKNSSTKTAKSAYAIPSKNRILLTGTPVQNNLREMWTLFDFACQGTLLGTAKTFKTQYENPITRAREKDATPGEKALGSRMSENLMTLIKPYFLRRTKSEVQKKKTGGKEANSEPDNHQYPQDQPTSGAVMPKLTRKNDLIVWTYLSAVQEDIYRQFISLDHIKELLMTTKSPLAELNILKKLCDHPRLLSANAIAQLGLDQNPQGDNDETDVKSIANVSDETLISESGKLVFLLALLERLREEGHRTLVFAHYRTVLDILQRILGNRGFKLLRLDGTITQITEREKLISRFQTDKRYSVFLLTTQVGGVGITLTAANRVVIYDPSWNPATDAQAVDRAYRIGQTENVVIYRLITCGTVEEKIYRRQVFKDSLIRQNTGDTKNPFRYFSRQELKELFTLEDPRSSSTQLQLQDLHSRERRTDPALDEHIAQLHAMHMFGISDHDLMFSLDVNHDEDPEDQEACHYIEGRVQKAQELMKAESELQMQLDVGTEPAWQRRQQDTREDPNEKNSKHLKPSNPQPVNNNFSNLKRPVAVEMDLCGPGRNEPPHHKADEHTELSLNTLSQKTSADVEEPMEKSSGSDSNLQITANNDSDKLNRTSHSEMNLNSSIEAGTFRVLSEPKASKENLEFSDFVAENARTEEDQRLLSPPQLNGKSLLESLHNKTDHSRDKSNNDLSWTTKKQTAKDNYDSGRDDYEEQQIITLQVSPFQVLTASTPKLPLFGSSAHHVRKTAGENTPDDFRHSLLQSTIENINAQEIEEEGNKHDKGSDVSRKNVLLTSEEPQSETFLETSLYSSCEYPVVSKIPLDKTFTLEEDEEENSDDDNETEISESNSEGKQEGGTESTQLQMDESSSEEEESEEKIQEHEPVENQEELKKEEPDKEKGEGELQVEEPEEIQNEEVQDNDPQEESVGKKTQDVVVKEEESVKTVTEEAEKENLGGALEEENNSGEDDPQDEKSQEEDSEVEEVTRNSLKLTFIDNSPNQKMKPADTTVQRTEPTGPSEPLNTHSRQREPRPSPPQQDNNVSTAEMDRPGSGAEELWLSLTLNASPQHPAAVEDLMDQTTECDASHLLIMADNKNGVNRTSHFEMGFEPDFSFEEEPYRENVKFEIFNKNFVLQLESSDSVQEDVESEEGPLSQGLQKLTTSSANASGLDKSIDEHHEKTPHIKNPTDSSFLVIESNSSGSGSGSHHLRNRDGRSLSVGSYKSILWSIIKNKDVLDFQGEREDSKDADAPEKINIPLMWKEPQSEETDNREEEDEAVDMSIPKEEEEDDLIDADDEMKTDSDEDADRSSDGREKEEATHSNPNEPDGEDFQEDKKQEEEEADKEEIQEEELVQRDTLKEKTQEDLFENVQIQNDESPEWRSEDEYGEKKCDKEAKNERESEKVQEMEDNSEHDDPQDETQEKLDGRRPQEEEKIQAEETQDWKSREETVEDESEEEERFDHKTQDKESEDEDMKRMIHSFKSTLISSPNFPKMQLGENVEVSPETDRPGPEADRETSQDSQGEDHLNTVPEEEGSADVGELMDESSETCEKSSVTIKLRDPLTEGGSGDHQESPVYTSFQLFGYYTPESEPSHRSVLQTVITDCQEIQEEPRVRNETKTNGEIAEYGSEKGQGDDSCHQELRLHETRGNKEELEEETQEKRFENKAEEEMQDKLCENDIKKGESEGIQDVQAKESKSREEEESEEEEMREEEFGETVIRCRRRNLMKRRDQKRRCTRRWRKIELKKKRLKRRRPERWSGRRKCLIVSEWETGDGESELQVDKADEEDEEEEMQRGESEEKETEEEIHDELEENSFLEEETKTQVSEKEETREVQDRGWESGEDSEEEESEEEESEEEKMQVEESQEDSGQKEELNMEEFDESEIQGKMEENEIEKEETQQKWEGGVSDWETEEEESKEQEPEEGGEHLVEDINHLQNALLQSDCSFQAETPRIKPEVDLPCRNFVLQFEDTTVDLQDSDTEEEEQTLLCELQRNGSFNVEKSLSDSLDRRTFSSCKVSDLDENITVPMKRRAAEEEDEELLLHLFNKSLRVLRTSTPTSGASVCSPQITKKRSGRKAQASSHHSLLHSVTDHQEGEEGSGSGSDGGADVSGQSSEAKEESVAFFTCNESEQEQRSRKSLKTDDEEEEEGEETHQDSQQSGSGPELTSGQTDPVSEM